MVTPQTHEPASFVLSRDELLVVLSLLQAQTLPGVDADPLGPRDAGQQALALAVAERGLRARGLARRRADGQLILRRDLISTVGVCAYAQSSISVHHWPSGGQEPLRFFGHVRGAEVSAHSRPEDVLHVFTQLPGREQLIDRLLAVIDFEDVIDGDAPAVTLSRQEFVQVREAAAAGALAGGSVAAPAGLAAAWAADPQVTLIQTIKATPGAVEQHDATLIRGANGVWWVMPTGTAEDSPVALTSIGTQELRKALLGWL
jgi:hypothetical protein